MYATMRQPPLLSALPALFSSYVPSPHLSKAAHVSVPVCFLCLCPAFRPSGPHSPPCTLVAGHAGHADTGRVRRQRRRPRCWARRWQSPTCTHCGRGHGGRRRGGAANRVARSREPGAGGTGACAGQRRGAQAFVPRGGRGPSRAGAVRNRPRPLPRHARQRPGQRRQSPGQLGASQCPGHAQPAIGGGQSHQPAGLCHLGDGPKAGRCRPGWRPSGRQDSQHQFGLRHGDRADRGPHWPVAGDRGCAGQPGRGHAAGGGAANRHGVCQLHPVQCRRAAPAQSHRRQAIAQRG